MSSSLKEKTIEAPRFSLVINRANELSRSYSSPPIPVLEIAEMSGVDVVFHDLNDFSESVAGFCDFQNSRIYVNSKDPINRQNFTMAHELGHWILHRDIFLKNPEDYPILPRFQAPHDGDPLEVEANVFAANLLVPDRLLKPVKGAPISMLAPVFSVSQSMMENRLKNVR